MVRLLVGLFFCFLVTQSLSAQTGDSVPTKENKAAAHVDTLEKPLYSPFTERYILDELKQLRIDQAAQKHEMMQQILDREHKSVDRAVSYATDTVTYFFYLIAAATSILVLVGWNSLRDIKERVHLLADEQISQLVTEYEKRLGNIEKQLKQKTLHIEENREEIELTREIQSLWLRAGQDSNPSSKITIYDQIIKLNPDDCEALTYKADAVLEIEEPQWAINLCHQALVIDPENAHAFYQLACAYSSLEQPEEAIKYLKRAIDINDGYREDIHTDKDLQSLREHHTFQQILSENNAEK